MKKPVFDIGDTQNKPVFEPIKEARFDWAFDRNFCDLSNNVYGWHKATPEMLFFSAIAKLKEYESSSWMNMPKGARFHSVPWVKLSDNVKKRLNPYIDKGCTLCQIAGKGSHRIIGVKLGNVFYPVWNDEKHKIYPMS